MCLFAAKYKGVVGYLSYITVPPCGSIQADVHGEGVPDYRDVILHISINWDYNLLNNKQSIERKLNKINNELKHIARDHWFASESS